MSYLNCPRPPPHPPQNCFYPNRCVFVCAPAAPPARPCSVGERGRSLPSFARLVPLPVPQCVFDTSQQRGAAGQRITRVTQKMIPLSKLLTLFFASSEISKHPLPSPSKKKIEIDVQFGSFFFKSYFGFTTKRYKIQVYNQTVPNPGLPPNSTTKP